MQSAFTTEQKNKINCFKHVKKHTPKLQQTNPPLANNIEQKKSSKQHRADPSTISIQRYPSRTKQANSTYYLFKKYAVLLVQCWREERTSNSLALQA
jgi:hypothetical protein